MGCKNENASCVALAMKCILPAVNRAVASLRVLDYRLYTSARARCTRWIEIAASPTADATRFTFPERMSPTAKTAGKLVSSICGGLASGHSRGAHLCAEFSA